MLSLVLVSDIEVLDFEVVDGPLVLVSEVELLDEDTDVLLGV